MSWESFTADGSWNWPNGVTAATVEALGGGGAGGYATANPSYCGGGKGGGYAKKAVTKGAESSLFVIVGAGGISVSATHGEPSEVGPTGGSSVCIAVGGQSVAIDGSGGATGVNGTATGDTTYDGGNGAGFSGTSSGGGGGAAGPTGAGGNASGTTGGTANGGTFADESAHGGNGGNGVAVRNVGNPGYVYGGAGSGGSTNQATNKLGGAGMPGFVLISWIPPVALTGVDATGAVQSIDNTFARTVTGAAGTGDVGFATAQLITAALTGWDGTGGVGTLDNAIIAALSNNLASGDVGTMIGEVEGEENLLLGMYGTAAVGDPTPGITVQLRS